MPDLRLFDSSSLTPPPDARIEVVTSTRELTPEEKEEAWLESARRYLDAMFMHEHRAPALSEPVGYTTMTEMRFRL